MRWQAKEVESGPSEFAEVRYRDDDTVKNESRRILSVAAMYGAVEILLNPRKVAELS